MRKDKCASRRSCRASRKRAGPLAAMFGSTFAGVQLTTSYTENMPRNWWHSRRTSFWPRPPQAFKHCSTRTAPCPVFAMVGDPVGTGLVASLARPGGSTTGFTPMEFGFGAKWVELLKEIAPRVTRVAVLRDLTIGPAQLSAIQAVAPSFGVELSAVGVGDVGEIERIVAAFARSSNAGLIVTASTSATVHRDLITMLAARYRLPAVYPFRYYVT